MNDSLLDLLGKINETLRLLDEAVDLIHAAGLEPRKDNTRMVGSCIADLLELRHIVYEAAPSLRPSDHGPGAAPTLTAEEEAIAASLNDDLVRRIDEDLMSHARQTNRKVALIVGLTMRDPDLSVPGLSDVYYARRVKTLVARGMLIGEGDLDHVGRSEVRLPAGQSNP
jgi:hypothetical protein